MIAVSPQPIERVLARHCRILADIERFEDWAAQEHPGESQNLTLSRWNFARELLVHFADMETHAYSPMMNDPRPEAQTRAARASGETLQLVHAFREHVIRWHGPVRPMCWETHRRAVTQLLARIRRRIDAEAMDIVPLMAQQPSGTRAIGSLAESYAAEAWRMRDLICGTDKPLAA